MSEFVKNILGILIFIGSILILMSSIAIFRLRHVLNDKKSINLVHFIGQGNFGMLLIFLSLGIYFSTIISWMIAILGIIIFPISSSYISNRIYMMKKKNYQD